MQRMLRAIQRMFENNMDAGDRIYLLVNILKCHQYISTYLTIYIDGIYVNMYRIDSIYRIYMLI